MTSTLSTSPDLTININNLIAYLEIASVNPGACYGVERMLSGGLNGFIVNHNLNDAVVNIGDSRSNGIVSEFTCPLVKGKNIITYLDSTDCNFAVIGSYRCIWR